MINQLNKLKNFCNRYNKIYIYGAGIVARDLSAVMRNIGCKYDSYIVSKKDNNVSCMYGHPVFEKREVDFDRPNIGVILGVSKRYQDEIKEELKKIGFKNIFSYYTDYSFSEENLPIYSLPKRLELLKEAISNNKCIGVLISSSIGSNYTDWRYRAYNICQIMKKYSKKWIYVYFSQSEIYEIVDFFDKIHVITFLRLKWTFQIDEFIKKAKKENVVLLYSIDDLVFNNNHAKRVLMNSTTSCRITSYNNVFGLIARNRMIMDQVDGFLATNTYLATCLEKEFKKPCKIVRNFLNEEQIEISNHENLNNNQERNEFTIGYFSGSFTHQQDFLCCASALSKLLAEYDDIKLRIVGYLNIPSDLEVYQQQGRIEEIPQVDFITLQKLISDVDINLAPLLVDEFTNCKSELKFFEAAIMSVPTCASPTVAFQECIQSGENGFLCKDENEWYENLKLLYQDFSRRKDMGIKAREYAIQNYTGKKIVEMIENAYDYWYSKK